MPHKVDGFQSPSDSVSIELDPNNNGSIVQKAFLAESIFNFGTLPMITHPHKILSYLLMSPAQITPATVLLARFTGLLIVGPLSVALWTGVPNTKTAIESRRGVYIALGIGELALLPLLIIEAMKGGNADAALSPLVSLMGIASLAPLCLWRAYVLLVKPEMMGRYREAKRD